MNDFLKELLNYVEATKDFTLEQAPDIFYQFALFIAVDPIVSILIALSTIFAVCKSMKILGDMLQKDEDFQTVGTLINSLKFLIPIIGAVMVQETLVLLGRIVLSPKIVLIEYLRGYFNT